VYISTLLTSSAANAALGYPSSLQKHVVIISCTVHLPTGYSPTHFHHHHLVLVDLVMRV
jgi:hypothetical protein